jgi:hypothetical protein
VSYVRLMNRGVVLACVLVVGAARAQGGPGEEPARASPAAESRGKPAPTQEQAFEAEGEEPDSPMVTVKLRDGQQFHGWLLRKDERELELQLPSGGKMVLSLGAVASVTEDTRLRVTQDGILRRDDPNRTRYLYAPSAHMLKAGEGYFSAKELVFYSLGYGITDNVTVLAGTVPYLMFIGPAGINLIAAVKVGGAVTPWLHVAGGAEVFVLPGLGAAFGAGIGFGAVTLGDPNLHLTVAVGRPFAFTPNAQAAFGDAMFTLNGTARLSPTVSLVSENWFFPSFSTPYRDPLVLNGLAVRLIVDRLAVDLGFIGVKPPSSPYWPVPVPWLDFTWNFGG